MNVDLRQLGIYLALIPGLITMTVARLMSGMPGADAAVVIMAIFLASLLDVGPVALIAHLVHRARQQAIAITALPRWPPFLPAVFLVSIVNGVLLAMAYENAWANRIVMWGLGNPTLFSKKSEHSAFQMTISRLPWAAEVIDRRCPSLRNCGVDKSDPPKKSRILEIYLADGTRLQGYLEMWSGEPKINEIYLSPACAKTKDATQFEPIAGAGTLIRTGDAVRIDVLDEVPRLCPVTLRRTKLQPLEKCQALIETPSVCQRS